MKSIENKFSVFEIEFYKQIQTSMSATRDAKTFIERLLFRHNEKYEHFSNIQFSDVIKSMHNEFAKNFNEFVKSKKSFAENFRNINSMSDDVENEISRNMFSENRINSKLSTNIQKNINTNEEFDDDFFIVRFSMKSYII